jgi:hypothetical protein
MIRATLVYRYRNLKVTKLKSAIFYLLSSTGSAWEMANKPKITATAKYFIVVQR